MTKLRFQISAIALVSLFSLSVSAANNFPLLTVQYKPQGANIAPKEKQMCTHKKRLYEVGTRLEIGGKEYICTLVDSPEPRHTRWALAPG